MFAIVCAGLCAVTLVSVFVSPTKPTANRLEVEDEMQSNLLCLILPVDRRKTKRREIWTTGERSREKYAWGFTSKAILLLFPLGTAK